MAFRARSGERATREAGEPAAPTVLLLHGFPISSHRFRTRIPELAGLYFVVAPDLPGPPIGFRLALAHPERVAPESFTLDQLFLDQPGHHELDLFGDYRTNLELYPAFSGTCGRTDRRPWPCGVATTGSFCRPAPRPSDATFRRQKCTLSRAAISPWRRM